MIPIKQNKKLLPNAKKLRKTMTPQENHLWYDFLRSYPVHIYRQRIIDNYIADFYCPSAKLIIELDGSQHYTTEGLAYDQIRTEALAKYDLEVIRFPNSDINRNFHSVCTYIDHLIKQRT